MSKVVLVTGANRGIGLSVATTLLKSCADVLVVLACRDQVKGNEARQQLVAEIENADHRTLVLEMDVSLESSVQRAAGVIRDQFGHLFAVVNNAGIAYDLAWDKSANPKKGDAKLTLDCNLFGVESCSRNFLPLLQDGGAIVNISSGAAGMNMWRMSDEKRAWMLRDNLTWEELKAAAKEFAEAFDQHVETDEMPRRSEHGWWLQAYGFSKACVNAYTRVLAARHSNVRINCCTPGFCLTDMTKAYDKADMLRSAKEGAETPVFLVLGDQGGVTGKMWGPAQEVMPWVTEPK